MHVSEQTIPWFKQGWPWFLISLPLSAVIAGSVTLWLALNSEHSMVVDDYYRHGKAINQRIARDVQAAQFGLAAELRTSGEHLQLALTHAAPANAAFKWPASLTVRAIHPSQAARDQAVLLHHVSAGRYQGQTTIEPGRWRIHIEEALGQWRLVSELSAFGTHEVLKINHRPRPGRSADARPEQ